MADVIELVNRTAPIPPSARRRRVWVQAGDYVALRGGVALHIERQRDGEHERLLLHFAAAFGADIGEAWLPHSQMFRFDGVAVVPRALAHRAGRPIAVLLELDAAPAALSTAIEAIA